NYTTAVIGVQAASYVAVVNCDIHDIYDQTSGTLSTGYADHVIFRNNRMFNIGDPSRGFNGTGDHAVYLSEGSFRTVVEGNVLEKIAGFGVHGWGHYAGVDSGDFIIRGNTIINAASSGTIIAGTKYSNVYIYNNTIYEESVPY